jgi:5-enolpyruvylshikimate-3-phosphate synthase
MSFAVAGTAAAGPVRIRDVAAVETSFPGFEGCLSGIGADIVRLQDNSA